MSSGNRDGKETKGVFLLLPLTPSFIPENIPRSFWHDPDVPSSQASHCQLESRHSTQEDTRFSPSHVTPHQNLPQLPITFMKEDPLLHQAFKATPI